MSPWRPYRPWWPLPVGARELVVCGPFMLIAFPLALAAGAAVGAGSLAIGAGAVAIGAWKLHAMRHAAAVQERVVYLLCVALATGVVLGWVLRLVGSAVDVAT